MALLMLLAILIIEEKLTGRGGIPPPPALLSFSEAMHFSFEDCYRKVSKLHALPKLSTHPACFRMQSKLPRRFRHVPNTSSVFQIR